MSSLISNFLGMNSLQRDQRGTHGEPIALPIRTHSHKAGKRESPRARKPERSKHRRSLAAGCAAVVRRPQRSCLHGPGKLRTEVLRKQTYPWSQAQASLAQARLCAVHTSAFLSLRREGGRQPAQVCERSSFHGCIIATAHNGLQAFDQGWLCRTLGPRRWQVASRTVARSSERTVSRFGAHSSLS